MKQKFTAPRFGATVVIFEPSRGEIPEEVVETFEVGPYEEIEYDFESHTQAFRFENLHSRDDAGERPAPPPDQEARDSTPDHGEETKRGAEAYKANMQLAKKFGLPTEPEEGENLREYVKEKEEAKRKASSKKAAKKPSTNGRRKKRGGPPAAPEENEGAQIAAAKNPMTNPDPEMRGTTGKKPEEQHDAAGRKAGDKTNAKDAKQQGRSRS